MNNTMIRTTLTQSPKGRDLTHGSIHRAIWRLAPPMMLEMAILNVAQVLDAYWVSQLGSAALAAVTISATIRWVLNSLANGLGAGGMAVAARRVGAGQPGQRPVVWAVVSPRRVETKGGLTDHERSAFPAPSAQRLNRSPLPSPPQDQPEVG